MCRPSAAGADGRAPPPEAAGPTPPVSGGGRRGEAIVLCLEFEESLLYFPAEKFGVECEGRRGGRRALDPLGHGHGPGPPTDTPPSE